MKCYLIKIETQKENGQWDTVHFGYLEDIDEAMNIIMLRLFENIGNGDMENGGEGSLWRCAKEIYDTIRNGEVYSYANFKFSVQYIPQ